ncbi:MAG: tetratricopeptide repeat protein, partial [Alteromonas sp.]|nr:tetratricopeptide repeat protein [Alteromonas sp.]
MEGQTTSSSSSERLSKRDLRSSFLLPIGITIAIWLVGLLIFVLAPGRFDTAVSVIITISLIGYLWYTSRQEQTSHRITAVLFAIPALIGITLGLLNGRSSFTLIGVAITIFLLALLRFLNTPISYRIAYRQFLNGNQQQALRLINKSIEAQPEFWESYQLRALIRLARLDFQQAENDVHEALKRKPKADTLYNTLGQIHLANAQFSQAQRAYEQALKLESEATAVYQYHLGLSHYRQNQYQAAAEQLSLATQGTLPIIEYDLWTHYYLHKSLVDTGDKATAREAKEAMKKFADALPILEEQIQNQPNF